VERALIFVIEEVRITILQKQPSLKDPALNSWRLFWARDILGLQKWKGRIDERGDNSFVAFACTSQETAAHGHVVHGCCQNRRQRVPRTAAVVSGNERCMVAASLYKMNYGMRYVKHYALLFRIEKLL
jgi:hypothetical protein